MTHEEIKRLAREFMSKWIADHYIVKTHSGPLQEMATGEVENMLVAFATDERTIRLAEAQAKERE